MRIDRRFVGWGIFFIILGGIPLLAQQGLLETDAIRAGPSLWPLFIVGIGLSLLLRGTALDWVGGLLVAATAGLIAGSLLTMGGSFGGICSGEAGGPTQTSAVGALSDGGAVVVDQPCGDLTLRTVDGSEWSFDPGNDGPPAELRQEGNAIHISGGRDGRFGFGPFGQRTSWNVTVPRDPTLDLSVSGNAGQVSLDLEGAHLDELRIEMNAGSARVIAGDVKALRAIDLGLNAGSLAIWLPALSFAGHMEANAGSIDLCVPPGTGLLVTMSSNITTAHNLDERGLTRSGDIWTRNGSNGTTIELTIEANAGSITLDPEEGC